MMDLFISLQRIIFEDFAFLIKDLTVKKEQNSEDFISLNNK